MSTDRSFRVELAFRRFLDRCPELAKHSRFDTLAREGAGAILTEEDVVSAVADIFLHPKYTIPLVGCLRPLARKIVERVVALLRHVPNLRSNSSGMIGGNGSILNEAENLGDNIIEQHVRNGMELNLHELACLAFCRALDLAPFLMGTILCYFKLAPPPFERIMAKGINFGLSIEVNGHLGYLVDVVRTSYRMLVISPEVFSKIWDWSCFLDLANQFREFSGSTGPGNGAADIRWCIAQILLIIFKLGDTSTALGIGDDEALKCLLRWEAFCQDASLEKAGLYIVTSDQIESDATVAFSQDSLLGSLSTNSTTFSPSTDRKGSRSPKLAPWDEKLVNTPFILTSSLRKSFEMALLAVSQKWPVLLYGPPGVGKSALIRKLAQDSGNYVLYIHMDDQIDGKTLVGSYVCTEKPGEFRWQPGSLTQAVQNGFWVVFEDIDKAPSDVHSILLPLLEGSTFFVTGHGEEIKVGESFRLFATVSASRHNASSGSNWPGTLWRKVMIRQSSYGDLKDIVKSQFPSLESLSDKLIETFEKVNGLTNHNQGWNSTSTSVGRFSLRDLLKWCKRIVGLDLCFVGGSLSLYECQRIYGEAVDVFAAFISSAEYGRVLRKEIAKIWAVPASAAEGLYPNHKPVIQESLSELTIGRAILQKSRTALSERKYFVGIRRSLHAIERIACSVRYNEPVLLVGETGTGKTTLVQDLASRLGQKLTVLNLSQQSDVADLLGGFKPISPRYVCLPLYKEFVELFSKTFSSMANADFMVCLEKHKSDKKWKVLLNGMQKGVKSFRNSMEARASRPSKKRKKPFSEDIVKTWDDFSMKLETACGQLRASSGMVFSFVEGAFISALRNGEWILLDEVNLAPAETLQRIGGVLEGEEGSICLAERGDASFIKRHPNFRIFACMNPATDAGKRDLPYSIRSRFTEYFIDDLLGDDDLSLFVGSFVDETPLKENIVKRIISFYREAKKQSEERLQDGANQKPQYSLRSLFRALEYTSKALKQGDRLFTLEKALYDGFSMFFLTMLDRPSTKIMEGKIMEYLLVGKKPHHIPFNAYIAKTDLTHDDFMENYVITKTVSKQLINLSRAVFIRRYPVLLQGPTSSGKTSLVRYLAAITGREFVRINNHEHTDLQEYLGSYITDSTGKLVFHEGVLVRAVRSGSWIVLDELNLAPSDVLEALNRLLDDNRELFVPELQETIKAHPNFMLFATQNPPTVYAGRKVLSRAFRNRFVEIHVDEIPEEELSTILESRCKISPSYAKKMVEVMMDLQLYRPNSKVFAGKHGYITPRDLFRWANRVTEVANSRGDPISMKHRYEDLAKEGYYLLAERLRDESEKSVVKEVLERHFHLTLHEDDLYKQKLSEAELAANSDNNLKGFSNVIWTKSMWRMYSLVKRCYELREPVLLVGETGGGKTTVCQWLSVVLKSNLHILNCHQYTETSDFIGGFYPVRERSRLIAGYEGLVKQLMSSHAFIKYSKALAISCDIAKSASTLDQLGTIINDYRRGLISPGIPSRDVDAFEQMKKELEQFHEKWQTIFTWQDGPLVEAMKAGHLFLVDEISLADDSVLERLNSVLEPERTLSLPEKGGSVMEKITAHKNFFVLATMNPGGDFGKKELSPALRNRFTEIWVPSVTDPNDLRNIASQRISKPEFSCVVDPMTKFWEWFNKLQMGRTLTIRDLLSWVYFVNVTGGSLGVKYAFLHGVFLVLLDGLSLGTGIHRCEAEELRERCVHFLLDQLEVDSNSFEYLTLSKMENYGRGNSTAEDISGSENMDCDNVFGIDPFYVKRGNFNHEAGGFELLAPTTRRNALRVLRAMQLRKPVLLEGSPGVGKTSLVVALGKFSGHKVVRINLSEQTDMMDLLGCDLPVESDEGIKFAWSDGILLKALKEGCWVLLDELNLAPQSVLEGLNAILDHRAEVYIPELNQTFSCPPSFRVFACQNPTSQGGGRKGLPKSFLNRFTKVYVDELVEEDYLSICTSLFPSLPKSLLSKLVLFNKQLHEETMTIRKFAQDGSPWEFNLRDVIRACEIIKDAPEKSRSDCFLNLLYVQRMRTASDRKEVLRLFEQIFKVKPFINPFPRVHLNSRNLIVGNTTIKRNNPISRVSNTELKLLPSIRLNLEAAANCVKRQWLGILIGPSSSGKTSLIRILAQLTGNVLHELNLSSATDISELLGCFEQYSVFRNLRSIASRIEQYVNEYCRVQFKLSVEASASVKRDIISRWHSFRSLFDLGDSSNSTSGQSEEWRKVDSALSLLMEIVEHLKLEATGQFSWYDEELDRIMDVLLKLQQLHQRTTFSAKFEWVTGVLGKAVESGEWIVLEDANLCNPTVLDRINSLVEPSGSITVNEGGTVDGKPLILHPHPNFRMFLTVNPRYGEVSRAMRNRGVEMYMMEPFWLLDGKGESIQREMEFKDVKRFLIQSGIPNLYLVDSMARSHIHTREEASCLNVSITYFELARWVQLFQQLLMSGNRPLWSLRISFEHIYLSSLGESEGENIVVHAVDEYLSMKAFLGSDSSVEPLCLPGGWPSPLQVRDFVWNPDAATIKQNCMYLEYLGAKSATCRVGQTSHSLNQALSVNKGSFSYWMDIKMLHQVIFSDGKSTEICDRHGKDKRGDLSLADQMILFTADWTIEQASEHDLSLYFSWFSWFSCQLLPFSQTLSYFVSTLKEELSHPIWKYINDCAGKLKSASETDTDLQRVPLLSSKIVDLAASHGASVSDMSACRLQNAINSIGLLRRSYQQRSAEKRQNKFPNLQPLLKSLGSLEEKVLEMLPECPCFDVLVRLCNDLVEDHKQFWVCVTSHNDDKLRFDVDKLLFFWRLLKDAEKLQAFCHEAGATIVQLKESRDLIGITSWNLYPKKSLLWIHGGHPLLPPSSDIYKAQLEFFDLCYSIWPMKKNSSNNVHLVASLNPELRSLAVQGICIASHLSVKDTARISDRLKEMHQMLLGRFEHEKCKLETSLGSNQISCFKAVQSSCCNVSPHLFLTEVGRDCSWLDFFCINDYSSFFLDMKILQEISSVVLLEPEQLKQALGNVSHVLDSALGFSLNFSLRSPQMFSGHQKLLWTLDAWNSIDAVNMKIAAFVLEMWFRWHSSMWNLSFISSSESLQPDGYDFSFPDILMRPFWLKIAHNKCHSISIKDYSASCLKLRVASRSIWQNCLLETEVPTFLVSTAHAVFEQIVHAHRKSFTAEKFQAIKSLLVSSRITEDEIQTLSSLFLSSSHQGLRDAQSFVVPLLRQLYIHLPANGHFDLNAGLVWFYIGRLRYRLLISTDDLDPAIKYSFKQSLLEQKKTLLELEMKVRQECDYLAGWSSEEHDNGRVEALSHLVNESTRIQRKVLFRSDAMKFKKLRGELTDFFDREMYLVANFEGADKQMIIKQICDWQKTSISFIDRLSTEYCEYLDIVQPVQVAIYEMKLGMSLILSSIFEENFLKKIGKESIDGVMATVHSFMRFPRAAQSKLAVQFSSSDIRLLENLVSVTTASHPDEMKQESLLELKAAVHHNILVQAAHFITNGRVMRKTSFTVLDDIFNAFAEIWLGMKDQLKEKEELASQMYKFRTRRVKIEDVIEVDISTLGESFKNENFMEWQDLANEEALEEGHTGEIKAAGESENLEETWNLMEEPILNDIVKIHVQLFGSSDLVVLPGTYQISDEEILESFTVSYRMGTRMIKDLCSLKSAVLDATLMPEHLLHFYLEHERKHISSRRQYNFYKDPNAPVMAHMVKSLADLEQRVVSLLNEKEDHPGLQKLLDIVKMLLAIPVSTPLAKALSGLQYLLNQAIMVKESSPKLSLTDQLDHITGLVISWQKIEFEAMPMLLDELQEQYEINAAKLWFPLYSVLPRHSADVSAYSESTIQSLHEFMYTSNVGEYKKRLQLILAFHGQINIGRQLGIYSSPHYEEYLKILYNLFGLHVQFLPIIMEYMERSRKATEKEVGELLKLCKWERLMSMENSKRMRQRLKKLIRKYSDALQQPVKLVLNQSAAPSGIDMQFLQAPQLLYVFPEENAPLLIKTNYDDRFLWYNTWMKNLTNLRSPMTHEISTSLSVPTEEAKSIIRKCSSRQTEGIYQEEWGDLMLTLEDIVGTVHNCGEIWKSESKSVRKRRAFSDLLEMLEKCGLAKHKGSQAEDQLISKWLLRTSHNPAHLLLKRSGTSDGLPHEADSDWKNANEYYFKSITSIQLLQHVSMNFHKDITNEQVKRSKSFLHQLATMQEEQRDALYDLARNLGFLRTCISSLEHSHEDSASLFSVGRNQQAILECLWQQKQLFDDLWSILREGSLLLMKVESNHLGTCQSVRAAAHEISALFERSRSVVQGSKEKLDKRLLKHDGAIVVVPEESFDMVVDSKSMVELILQNFQVLEKLEKDLIPFRNQSLDKSSVRDRLLNYLEDIFKKGKLVIEQFNRNSGGRKESRSTCDVDTNSEKKANEEFGAACEPAAKVLERIVSSIDKQVISDDSRGNIFLWKPLFDSYAVELRMDPLRESITKTVRLAEKLMSCSSREAGALSFPSKSYLENLSSTLNLIFDFGDGLLKDLLALHRMMCITTHTLAKTLALLYSKGFGTPAEEQVEDNGEDMSQNAAGTGMGEGAGVKDVSDQITDEDQLIGDSSKKEEEKDASSEVPNQNDKGIEMEDDFDADMVSVSSGDDDDDENEESDGEQIESAMGKTGDESQVVDEKHWDKNDDNSDPENKNQKYEPGTSIQDKGQDSLELRGKEEGEGDTDEPQNDGNEANGPDDLGGDLENNEDTQDVEDMQMDKKDAYMSPTGFEPDEHDPEEERDHMEEEVEGTDAMEEDPEGEGLEEEGLKEEDLEQNPRPVDDNVAEMVPEQATEVSDESMDGQDTEQKQDMDLTTQNGNLVKPEASGHSNDYVPTSELGTQLNNYSGASGAVTGTQELDSSNKDDVQNDLSSMSGVPSGIQSQQDIMVSGQSDVGKLTESRPESQPARDENSTAQTSQPNPYRNVGDALDGWKERAKVPIDLPQDRSGGEDDEVEDQNAEEYGFVTEQEKGMAQALGPATAEQINPQLDGNKDGEDGPTAADANDPVVDMEIEMQSSEPQLRAHSAPAVKQKLEETMVGPDSEKLHEEASLDARDPQEDHPRKHLESIVHARKSSPVEEILQLSEIKISTDNEVKPLDDQEILQISDDARANAGSQWRKCELRTTRLSQELAEQLRLVMEPTLASKLQGDYKTGKRINMKKVIPYIASHYRKDKIWLRRTRPNKRDYQVVVAVDDSLSMSVSGCGEVAVEALVTVCRALGQLEMGSLAVASFGKEGHMCLLHDFDRPFTAETGIKMISGLTFKQENTHADEPVANLLKNLSSMLDVNVARSRQPSGQNPLQQLVLIIGDGRFHEKSLNRRVRDFVRSKRMVAFVVLDSLEESIMDFKVVSVQGGNVKWSRYMDSFPFPYYIMLRNIEALPRALADLLRQWFELMQNSGD